MFLLFLVINDFHVFARPLIQRATIDITNTVPILKTTAIFGMIF